MSRRSKDPTLTIISWRAIPAQVTVRSQDTVVKRELSPRFQIAIDRAAMTAGLFGTDDYLQEWRRTSRRCGEDLDAEAEEAVIEIEARFTSEALSRLADAMGLDEEGT